VLIDGLSFSLPRNGLVASSARTGFGKTRCSRLIVGDEQPDSGLIKIGDTVKIGLRGPAEVRDRPGQDVWEAISGGESTIRVGNVEIPSRAYVAAFGFKGPDQQKQAGMMSGGERGRVNLALTLRQGGNLLAARRAR